MEAASRQRGCHPNIGSLPAVSRLDLVLDGAARGAEKWRLARLGATTGPTDPRPPDERPYPPGSTPTIARPPLPGNIEHCQLLPVAPKHSVVKQDPAPSLAQSALPKPGLSQTGDHRPIVSWHP
ncbi:hypothetical protein GCM10028790_34920 [Micromonospora taraxaci]